MLNNLGVSAKLYLLISIAAISLIGLGIYGIAVLEKMNANTQTLYADRVLPFQQLANIRFNYITEIAPMGQMVKNKSVTFSEAKNRVIKARQIINTNWNSYKDTYLTPEEALLFKQTAVLKKQADEACNSLLLALTKADAGALDRLIQQKFSTDRDPFVVMLTRLMSLQVRVGKQIFDNNYKIYRGTSQKFILLIFVFLFIALSLSLPIISNIKNLIGDILMSNILIKESEEKYHSLFEQASDTIYVLNAGGDFTNVNYSMCQMTGYTRDELLMMNVSSLLNTELLQINPLLHAKTPPGESVIGERKLIRKNGEIIDVEINGKKFNDNRVVVIVRDITARKQMESELKKAELKFRTLADKSMVGIYIVQKEKFVYVNPRFATIFGYTPEELTGVSPIETIIHPSYRAVAYKNTPLRMESEANSVNYEAMGKRKDGSTNWVEFYGSGALLEDEPTIIGSMIDITERKQAEQSLQLAYDQIKTQIAFIRDMVWKQSHILRSPLANLKALSTLLLTDPADKEILGYMEIEMERIDAAFVEMARDSLKDEVSG